MPKIIIALALLASSGLIFYKALKSRKEKQKNTQLSQMEYSDTYITFQFICAGVSVIAAIVLMINMLS